MKVLLIYTNHQRHPFPVAPDGLGSIAASLKAGGFRSRILDLCLTSNPFRSADRILRDFNPDVIGLSIRNLDEMYMGTSLHFQKILQFVDWLKGKTDALLILGGFAFSIYPSEFLSNLGINYGIRGEGETSLVEFIKQKAQGEDGLNTPNLSWMSNGEIHHNPIRLISDLNILPIPEFSEIDYKKYLKSGGFVGIETKRGCSFQCIYCNDKNFMGNYLRLKSVQRILKEMERVLKMDIHDIYFTDSVFSYPAEHAKAICQAIIQEKMHIHWMAQINPAGCDKELFELFKRSGCIGLDLTIDSVSNKMLKGLGRGFTCADIENSIGLLRRLKIPYAIYLVLGGPGEDEGTCDQTLSFLKSLPDSPAIFLNYGLRIYPETKLAGIAEKEKQYRPDLHFTVPQYFISSSLIGDFSRFDNLRFSLTNLSTPTDWNSKMAKLGLSIYKKVYNGKPYWKYSYLFGLVRKIGK